MMNDPRALTSFRRAADIVKRPLLNTADRPMTQHRQLHHQSHGNGEVGGGKAAGFRADDCVENG